MTSLNCEVTSTISPNAHAHKLLDLGLGGATFSRNAVLCFSFLWFRLQKCTMINFIKEPSFLLLSILSNYKNPDFSRFSFFFSLSDCTVFSGSHNMCSLILSHSKCLGHLIKNFFSWNKVLGLHGVISYPPRSIIVGWFPIPGNYYQLFLYFYLTLFSCFIIQW